MLINRKESIGLKRYNNSKPFVDYLNDVDDIYKDIEGHNPNKSRKILIVLDDVIADILSNT